MFIFPTFLGRNLEMFFSDTLLETLDMRLGKPAHIPSPQ